MILGFSYGLKTPEIHFILSEFAFKVWTISVFQSNACYVGILV